MLLLTFGESVRFLLWIASLILVDPCRTISRDETIYPSPIEFRPERFLTKEHGGDCATQDDIPMDPSKINFGYGKRYVTDRTLLLDI